MSKKEKIKISIAFGISLVLFGVFFLTSKITTPKEVSSLPIVNSTNTVHKTNSKTTKIAETILEVNGIKYESKITGVISVYQFMKKLQKEGKINFKDITYSGMGKFIEEINGVRNGNKSWIYYVNEKKANIGISNYKIKTGDVVSWKYE